MLAYTTSYFARSNYTGIAKFVSADFGLDKGAIGLLGSVFLYTYALSQLPWGIASDRWGSRKAIGIGVFLTGATLWGFANSATSTSSCSGARRTASPQLRSTWSWPERLPAGFHPGREDSGKAVSRPLVEQPARERR